MAKRVLMICGQEIICERNDGGKKCSYRNYELFRKVFGNKNVYLCMLTNCSAEDKETIFRISAYRTIIDRGINILRGTLFTSATNEQKIVDFIQKNRINIVLFERSMYGSLISRIKKRKLKCEIWIFVHNIEKQYFENKIKCNRFLYMLPYWKIVESEKRTFDFADYIITLTERDARLIKEIYGKKNNLTLPMAFYDEFNYKKLIKDNSNHGTKELLFIGTMFAPNYDGIKWFVENVMSELSGFHLTIVGKNFEFKRNDLERENVQVIGTVESLDKYYYSDNIMIMPIFYGNGMKIKVAEAMMYGKTILASNEALEGYEVDGIHGIYRCNTKEEYIKVIRTIDITKSYYNKMVRQLFLSKYCLESQINKCKKLWT